MKEGINMDNETYTMVDKESYNKCENKKGEKVNCTLTTYYYKDGTTEMRISSVNLGG